MSRNPEDLAKIKTLFEKLYNAHRYTQAHPAIDDVERFKKVVVAVEGWCDELETLGVIRQFSMCIYTFGSDWKICYQMVDRENTLPLDKQ